MVFVFKLACCFNCSFLLSLLRGHGMLWTGEVALGHSQISSFLPEKEERTGHFVILILLLQCV